MAREETITFMMKLEEDMASASDNHGGKAFVPAFARIRSIILDVTSNVVSALATSACLRHVATDKIRRERDRSTALVKAFFTCHEVVERALLLPIWETILSLLARGHSGLRKLDGDLQSICEAQGKGMEVHPLLWHSPTPTAFANALVNIYSGAQNFGEAVERCTPIAKEAIVSKLCPATLCFATRHLSVLTHECARVPQLQSSPYKASVGAFEDSIMEIIAKANAV